MSRFSFEEKYFRSRISPLQAFVLSCFVLVYLVWVFGRGVTLAVYRFLQRNPFSSLIERNHRLHRVIWVKTGTEKRNIKENSGWVGGEGVPGTFHKTTSVLTFSGQTERTTVSWETRLALHIRGCCRVICGEMSSSCFRLNGASNTELLMNDLCHARPPAVCDRGVIP